jgi:hypothetical protein
MSSTLVVVVVKLELFHLFKEIPLYYAVFEFIRRTPCPLSDTEIRRIFYGTGLPVVSVKTLQIAIKDKNNSKSNQRTYCCLLFLEQ